MPSSPQPHDRVAHPIGTPAANAPSRLGSNGSLYEVEYTVALITILLLAPEEESIYGLRMQVPANRLFVGAPPRGEAFRAHGAGVRGGAPLLQDARNTTDVCDNLPGFHLGYAYKNAGHCPALCVRLRAQAACDSAWLRARFSALNRARKLAVVRFSSMPMPCRARPPLTRSSM